MNWQKTRPYLPIFLISLTSFLMNSSTIIVVSLTPYYFHEILKTPIHLTGLIEGILEAISWIMRMVSGTLCDYLRRRKLVMLVAFALIVTGRFLWCFPYFLSILVVGRILDRMGNGLTGAARECFIADYTHTPDSSTTNKVDPGKAYGIRHSLAYLGSFLGGLLILYAWAPGHDQRVSLWYAFFLALIALTILFCPSDGPIPKAKPFKWSDLLQLKQDKYLLILTLLVFIYFLGPFSNVLVGQYFLEKNQQSNFFAKYLLVQNITGFILGPLIGHWTDHGKDKLMLYLGTFGFIIVDLMLLLGYHSSLGAIIIFAGIGLQSSVSQVVFPSWIAQKGSQLLMGSRFSLFFIVTAISSLLSNSMIGYFLRHQMETVAFSLSIFFCCITIFMIYFIQFPKVHVKRKR